MSSTPTARNYFDKQGYGDNDDLWGINNLNTDLDLIDESLDGVVTINSTGGTYTMSVTEYATNEARQRILVITGSLASNLIVDGADVEKWYWVHDQTTRNGFTVTIRPAGGTGVPVSAGAVNPVYFDGAGLAVDMMPSIDQLAAPSSSLDMNSQKIVNAADATDNQDLTTLSQVATLTSGANPLIGLTLYGNYY